MNRTLVRTATLASTALFLLPLAAIQASADPAVAGWQSGFAHGDLPSAQDLALAVNRHGGAAAVWSSGPYDSGYNLSIGVWYYNRWEGRGGLAQHVNSWEVAVPNSFGTAVVGYTTINQSSLPNQSVEMAVYRSIGAPGLDFVDVKWVNTSRWALVRGLFTDGANHTLVYMSGPSNLSLAAVTWRANGMLTTPIDLEPYPDSIMEAATASNDRGSAAVIWTQNVGGSAGVFARLWTSAGGWGPTTTLDANTGGLGEAKLAMDDGGNVTAIWPSMRAGADEIWSSRYAGGSWSTPLRVHSFGADIDYNYQTNAVAVDERGGARAVWSIYNNPQFTQSTVYSRAYTPTSGWGALEVIATGRSVSGHGVALTPEGGAIVIYADSNFTALRMRRAPPGGAWGPAESVQPVLSMSPAMSKTNVKANASGVVTFGWVESWPLGPIAVTREYVPDFSAPALQVAAPSEGQSFTVSTATVQGTTEPGASVSVNGLNAALRADGSFDFPIALRAGINALVFTTTDPSGNVATKTVNVTYADPAPGLTADLAAVRANLTALSTQLAVAQADLALANADLQIAQANISLLTGELAANTAALSAAFGALSDSQARLDGLEANGTASSAAIAAAEAELSAAQQNLTALLASQTSITAELNDQSAKATAAAGRLNATADRVADLSADLNLTQRDLAALQPQSNTSEAVRRAEASAASASMLAMVGLLLGAAGVGAAVVALMRARRPVRPSTSEAQSAPQAAAAPVQEAPPSSGDYEQLYGRPPG